MANISHNERADSMAETVAEYRSKQWPEVTAKIIEVTNTNIVRYTRSDDLSGVVRRRTIADFMRFYEEVK